MASEAERLPASTAGSTSGRRTAVPGDGIDLDVLERDLHELLGGYGFALRYAANMPWLGRSAVECSRRRRIGSGFWTRVYVETHVRKQLLTITECLRLRLLDATSAEEAARLKALGDELEAHCAPLFRWRRLTGLVSRLPPVAAAIPVLSAAAARPFAAGVSWGELAYALLVLAATALLLWIVVVWPSVRLGFRVKRVIFSGGVEFRRLRSGNVADLNALRTTGFNYVPCNKWLRWLGFTAFVPGNKWLGFTAPHYDVKGWIDGVEPIPFSDENIYLAESRVYSALRRRKPAEVPLDLLLRFWPYIVTALSVLYLWGLIKAIGTYSDYSAGDWLAYIGLGAAALAWLIAIVPGGIGLYRARPH